MATAGSFKVWRSQLRWGPSGLRLRGFSRSLSTADPRVPPKNVEVPDISLSVKADQNNFSLPSPTPPAAPTTPTPYYLDTHGVVLQLQGTGTECDILP